jgi:DNA-binding transcriptional regulator YhcF (GntR family)
MKSPRNPWQELLVTAIRTKVAPPRPEGFFTREEIAKEWGLKLNTATRHLDTLLKQKKVEMIRQMSVITSKDGEKLLRKLKMFKIIPIKPPRK